jgi:hypothetical protein
MDTHNDLHENGSLRSDFTNPLRRLPDNLHEHLEGTNKMNTVITKLIALVVMLVIIGSIYAFGIGNPVTIAIQLAILPATKSQV